MRRAVFFDLDDTLFDHQYCRHAALRHLVEEYSVARDVAFAEIARIHDKHLQTTHELLLDKILTLTQARHERMRLLFQDLGVELAGDDLEKADRVYRGAYEAARRPVPGALELLRAVREHCRTCVITNGIVATQRMKMQSCNLESLLDEVIISEEVGAKKPDRRIFEIALQKTDCRPEQAVMVGDSWPFDVIGARKAGIAAVWFNRNGIANPDPGAVPEIRSLEPSDGLLPTLIG